MPSRLTPLEIQKHRFSRKWKGLDPVEVGSFLDMAAEDLETLARENAGLQDRIRALEEENAEHRQRERILKETLVSAQRASEDIRGAAQDKAELIVREAEDSSERLTHNALQRAAGNRTRSSGSASRRCARKTESSSSSGPRPITGGSMAAVRRTSRSMRPARPCCPASWTRTPIRSGSATGAPRSAAGSRARVTL